MLLLGLLCMYICIILCCLYLLLVVFMCIIMLCYWYPQAIENIGNLAMGKWQQLMVPIKEMVDVLKVVREVSGIKGGSWVRIKRGMFKDDIARVSCVSEYRYRCVFVCVFVCVVCMCVCVCIA